MIDQGKIFDNQDYMFQNSQDNIPNQQQYYFNDRKIFNPLQDVKFHINFEFQKPQDQNQKSKAPIQNLHNFLIELDQNHDSEDEGIQDYKIGGYHPVFIGETLINRYVVIQKLGWGHFSTVWLCKDFKYSTYVAIKIQKSAPHYMEAAFDQVQILQKVQKNHKNPEWGGQTRDETHVVSLLNSFIHKTNYGNHFCMVFQILRCNLLDILKRYNYEGLPMDICQQISKQVLIGLDYLHRICGVIHTDLKPENVMVCLSRQEISDIVQNGQLTKNQLFAQRTQIFQKFLGIKVSPRENQNKNQEKINYQGLTKNQKRNLKKKLRKRKRKEGKQNIENNTKEEEQTPKSLEELFDFKRGKIVFNRGQKLKMPFTVKIADLGNACWKHHHFSTQIQTRQYRSPEVILGQTYNQSSDIWSFACMMYEMLTGDLLFQPKKGGSWSKNDDHLAQIQQLIGKFDINFALRGRKSKKYFDKFGNMRRVPQLQFWPIDTVLRLKHKIQAQQAKHFKQFLLPMLIPEPQLRIKASQALKLPWLTRKIQNYKMSENEYYQLKKQFNEMKLESQETNPKLYEEASCQDNDEQEQIQVGKKRNPSKRQVFIKYVDRSFTDLGYIGYCDGIALQDLDTNGNWQFL